MVFKKHRFAEHFVQCALRRAPVCVKTFEKATERRSKKRRKIFAAWWRSPGTRRTAVWISDERAALSQPRAELVDATR